MGWNGVFLLTVWGCHDNLSFPERGIAQWHPWWKDGQSALEVKVHPWSSNGSAVLTPFPWHFNSRSPAFLFHCPESWVGPFSLLLKEFHLLVSPASLASEHSVHGMLYGRPEEHGLLTGFLLRQAFFVWGMCVCIKDLTNLKGLLLWLTACIPIYRSVVYVVESVWRVSGCRKLMGLVADVFASHAPGSALV